MFRTSPYVSSLQFPRGVADAVNINTYVKQKRTGRAAKKVVKP